MLSFSLQDWDTMAAAFWWPLVRILAMIAVAPVLGHRTVPLRVKVALGVLVALVAAPTLPPPPAVPLDSWQGMALIGHEVMVGLALGFAVRIVFAAIEMVGEIVGLQMGLSFAGYFDPTSGGATNALSSWLSTMAMLLFLSINGHLLMIAGVVESFYTLPAALDGPAGWQPMRVVALGADLFRLALSISLPFVALLLLVNLAMGVASRVAPQLNIFAVGFPVTLMTGLALLTALLPYLETPLVRAMEWSVAVMVTR